MKNFLVGLALLCTLTLASAAIENPTPNAKPQQVTQQSGQTLDAQVSIPAPSQSGHRGAILSRAEADSLSILGNNLMSQSEVSEIRVGDINSNEVIYILIVVLLVVVIISVL